MPRRPSDDEGRAGAPLVIRAPKDFCKHPRNVPVGWSCRWHAPRYTLVPERAARGCSDVPRGLSGREATVRIVQTCPLLLLAAACGASMDQSALRRAESEKRDAQTEAFEARQDAMRARADAKVAHEQAAEAARQQHRAEEDAQRAGERA